MPVVAITGAVLGHGGAPGAVAMPVVVWRWTGGRGGGGGRQAASSAFRPE